MLCVAGPVLRVFDYLTDMAGRRTNANPGHLTWTCTALKFGPVMAC